MADFAKGVSLVLAPQDGESLWQPLPSTGYVTNKITPYNSPYDAFSVGIQVLEPGMHVRRHAHERSHEILFCYRGNGSYVRHPKSFRAIFDYVGTPHDVIIRESG